MPDEDTCLYRARAEEACVEMEQVLEEQGLGTDQLAHFWQHLTEQCTLRLVRLKPEMVRHIDVGKTEP